MARAWLDHSGGVIPAPPATVFLANMDTVLFERVYRTNGGGAATLAGSPVLGDWFIVVNVDPINTFTLTGITGGDVSSSLGKKFLFDGATWVVTSF